MHEQRPPGWRAAQREARRLMAARLFHAGELAHAAIARMLGVSPAAVNQWHTRWQRGGDRRLTARPTGHPRSKLSAARRADDRLVG
ncbi:MAG TPA: helix-turn-helix domain-containing protein [Gemmatimonadaceae bacterium]|nr:helix-turn-helix domain-containing protein [Gemmatimonadaceae bacterium]